MMSPSSAHLLPGLRDRAANAWKHGRDAVVAAKCRALGLRSGLAERCHEHVPSRPESRPRERPGPRRGQGRLRGGRRSANERRTLGDLVVVVGPRRRAAKSAPHVAVSTFAPAGPRDRLRFTVGTMLDASELAHLIGLHGGLDALLDGQSASPTSRWLKRCACDSRPHANSSRSCARRRTAGIVFAEGEPAEGDVARLVTPSAQALRPRRPGILRRVADAWKAARAGPR